MKNLRVNLMVRDVAETIAYYRDVFGASVTVTVPEQAPYDFALMRMGEVDMMFELASSLYKSIPALANKQLGGTFTLFIDVADVDSLHAKVQGKVAEQSELHNTFYGTREFHMTDLNGYIIVFAQTLGAQ